MTSNETLTLTVRAAILARSILTMLDVKNSIRARLIMQSCVSQFAELEDAIAKIMENERKAKSGWPVEDVDVKK